MYRTKQDDINEIVEWLRYGAEATRHYRNTGKPADVNSTIADMAERIAYEIERRWGA